METTNNHLPLIRTGPNEGQSENVSLDNNVPRDLEQDFYEPSECTTESSSPYVERDYYECVGASDFMADRFDRRDDESSVGSHCEFLTQSDIREIEEAADELVEEERRFDVSIGTEHVANVNVDELVDLLHDAHLHESDVPALVEDVPQGGVADESDAVYVQRPVVSGWRTLQNRRLEWDVDMSEIENDLTYIGLYDYPDTPGAEPVSYEGWYSAEAAHTFLGVLNRQISSNELRSLRNALGDGAGADFGMALFYDTLLELQERLGDFTPQGGVTEFLNDMFGIRALAGAIDKGVDKVCNATTDVRPKFEEAKEAINGVSGAINNVADIGRVLLESAGSLLEWLKKPFYGGLAALIAILVVNSLDDYYPASSIRLFKLLIGAAVMATVGAQYLVPLVSPWLQSFMPQAGLKDFGGLMLEGISIAVMGFSLDFGSGWDCTALLRQLSSIQMQTERVEKLIERLCDWVVKVITTFAEYFEIDVTKWLRTNNTEIAHLTKEMNEVMAEYIASPMHITATMAARVAAIQMRLSDLVVRNASASPAVKVSLSRLESQLSVLVRGLGDAGTSMGSRNAPNLYFFAGASGIGKTNWVNNLAEYAVPFLMTEAEVLSNELRNASNVFVWPVEPKHLDTYTGQAVTIMPDMGSRKEVAGGAASESAMLIYIAGDNPLNLPAADLAKKMRLWFISMLVLICTNLLYFSESAFPSISNVEALVRRSRPNGWYVQLNPKYAVMNPDGSYFIEPNTKRVRGYENATEYYCTLDVDKLPDTPTGIVEDQFFLRRMDYGTGGFADNKIYTQKDWMPIFVASLIKNKKAGERKAAQRAVAREEFMRMAREKILNPDAAAQAAVSEFKIDTEFEKIQASLKEIPVEKDEGYETADEGEKPKKYSPPKLTGKGTWVSTKTRGCKICKERKFKNWFAHSTEECRFYGKAQGDDTEHKHFHSHNWFSTEYDWDPEAVKQRVSRQRAFFLNVRKNFTKDVHGRLRCLYVHALAGCSYTSKHNCVCFDGVFTPETRKIDNDEIEILCRLLRLLANDDLCVGLVKLFNATTLRELCFFEYEKAIDQLEYFYLETIFRGDYRARMEYMAYTFYNNLGQMFSAFATSALEFIGPYYPYVELLISFSVSFAIGHAVGVAVNLLIGQPTYWKSLDKGRPRTAKRWTPEYLATLAKTDKAVFIPYYSMAEYEKACVEFDYEFEGQKVVGIPYLMPMVAQGSNDEEEKHIQTFKKVERNTYLLYFRSDHREVENFWTRHPCNIVMFGGNFGLFVNHAAESGKFMAKERTECRLRIAMVPFNGTYTLENTPFVYNWNDLILYDDPALEAIDLRVIEIPGIHPHAHLENILPPLKCLQYIKDAKARGYFLTRPTATIQAFSTTERRRVVFNMPLIIHYDDTPEFNKVDGTTVRGAKISYTYSGMGMQPNGCDFHTIEGDCSSPGFITDPVKNATGRLYGYAQADLPWWCYMHTSLTKTTMAGSMIYRELLAPYFEKMRIKPDGFEEHFEKNVSKLESLIEEAGFKKQGCPIELRYENTDVDGFHYSEMKVLADVKLVSMNQFTRSPMYDLMPKGSRVPSRMNKIVLRDGDHVEIIDVQKKASAPYGSNTVPQPERLLDNIMYDVAARVMSECTVPNEPKVLSYDQTFYGDVSQGVKGTNWNGSTGFTMRAMLKRFNIPNPGKGSRFMVNDEGRLLPEWEKIMIGFIEFQKEEMRQGRLPFNINTANLKSELLPREKVAEGKTREYETLDKHFIWLMKMYFGSWVGLLYKNRVRNGIAIGINPYSREWDDMYDHLGEHMKHIFGDYSKYDKRQRLILARIVIYSCLLYYKDAGSEAAMFREKILITVFCSAHIMMVDGKLVIYFWAHGNTSGNYLTGSMNSMIGIVLQHAVHIFAMLLAKGIDPFDAVQGDYDFAFVVRYLFYMILGDDFDTAVAPPLEAFSGFSVMKYILKTFFGMTITDELKGDADDVPEFRHISEGSFAGRKMVKGVYRGARKIWAALRLPSCWEQVKWIAGTTSVEIEVAKVELANLELCEWDEATFYSIVTPMAGACQRAYGVYPRFTNYEDARDRVMTVSCYRYAFDTFMDEDTYHESDLIKLGLLDLIVKNDIPANELNEFIGRQMDASISSEVKSTSSSVELSVSATESNKTQIQTSTIEVFKPQMDSTETDFDAGITSKVEGGTKFLLGNTVAAIGKSNQTTTQASNYVEQLADIKSFFSTPQVIASGAWTTGQANNTNLATIPIAPLIAAYDVWASKEKGFALFKGDFIAEAQFTASKFQQGKTILHYLPCVTEFVALNPKFLNRTNKNLVMKVQHPHVEVSCRVPTNAIRIPYVAPSTYYGVKEGHYDWGTIFLDVYSALLTGAAAPAGQLSVDYIIYGHWENVELIGKTVPQGDIKEVFYPQAGRREGKNRNVVPEKQENQGPIEDGLRKVGTTASMFSQIPLLSDFAGPVAWGADWLAGLAHTWGWSKPRELNGVNVVTDQLFRYNNTADGPDLAVPGGIICNNRVETLDYLSYTDMDEMSFDFLLKIPFYYGEIAWTAGAGQGTSLLSLQMQPTTFYSTTNDVVGAHTAVYRTYAPIGYFTQFFQYWRGGYEITAKCVKTQMHAGKLQFSWTPGTAVGTAPTIANGAYAMRTVVDFEMEDEVTINLPYLCYVDYLDMNNGPTSSGQLDIIVLNDLRAPESCSQTVNIQIFIRAADDFEFAVPKPNAFGLLPYIPQGSSVEEMHGSGAGDVIDDSAAGGVSINDKNQILQASRCIGEKIRSVKQLLMRMSPWVDIKGIGIAGAGSLIVLPDALAASQMHPATGVLDYPGLVGSALDFIAPMYAFQRGGSRFEMFTSGSNVRWTTAPQVLARNSTAPYVTGTQLGNNLLLSSNTPVTANSPITLTFEGSTQLTCGSSTNVYAHVPYYNRFPCSLTSQFNGVDQPMNDACIANTAVAIASTTVFGDSVLQRASTDDKQLMFFIGCPPILSAFT